MSMFLSQILLPGLLAISYFFVVPSVQAQQRCPYDPLSFTTEQNITLKDKNEQLSHLIDFFQKEYLVVDMSLEWCEHCVNSALSYNIDQDFISRVSGNSSCRFVALVESGTVIDWLQQIGGPASFVGVNSREVVDLETDYFAVPTLYGSAPLTQTPTFYILNRNGEVVVSRVGSLPDLFYSLCQSEASYGSGEFAPGNNQESGTGIVEQGAGGSCSGG